jgi:hypothetical protein
MGSFVFDIVYEAEFRRFTIEAENPARTMRYGNWRLYWSAQHARADLLNDILRFHAGVQPLSPGFYACDSLDKKLSYHCYTSRFYK